MTEKKDEGTATAPDDSDDLGDHPVPDGGDPTADLDGPPTADARVVVAQGTFDVLHPGHLHYFREAAAMGDWLVVIIARRSNVTHKDPPVVPDRQRREMVAGLGPVDEAVLGHPEDIFVPIERIRPEVIALGHDQHHDPDAIRAELDRRGIDCAVERASAREPRFEGELLSTNDIVERILSERGD
ncbi:FAD synthase [Halobacteriales archaeon QS_8_69_26]|nr:MAG: FAD synthase [Halobacteriales archaeon QS_8_69_26]